MSSKRQYGKWTSQEMSLALSAYRNGDLGFNECCRQYNIPKPTLKRHLESRNIVANEETKSLGRTATFSSVLEAELTNHILLLERCMFGLTISDVRRLAFEIAEKNNILHNFNKNEKMAGKKWFYAFKARNPQISLRYPESTSLARARGFNKENVQHFFDILLQIIDENKLDATRIFNVDESGYSTVQKKNQKILAKKGKKQVGAVSSAERGTNTTMVCCVSASGQYLPPMIIYKRLRWALELKTGAPPGGLVEISESGYINSDLFNKWLKHFVNVIKPNPEKKVLLLLDGHTTHSKNIDALNIAKDNGIILLQLPAHTTHRLQPLDKTFFGPLQTYYAQEVQNWLRCNPGQAVTQFQVSSLLAGAYAKAATIANAINGFKNTGIWPPNKDIYPDSAYAAADNLCEEIQNASEHFDSEAGLDENHENRAKSSDSANLNTVSESSCSPISSKGGLKVTIQELSPIPSSSSSCVRSKRKMSKGATKAVVLTSSPYKKELLAAKEKKKIKDEKSAYNKAKRALKLQNEETMSVDQPEKKKKKIMPIRPKEAVGDWYCKICEEKSIEDMIRCLRCNQWVHEMCAGVKPGKKNSFVLSAYRSNMQT